MNQSFKIISASVMLLLVAACTKELPFAEKLKVEVLDKSIIDTKADYLMSSSMLNASRSSADAMPFASGDNKRVRLEWGKESLRIVEMERDARFRENTTNNKLVMEIPIEHVDYQCAKDKYGDCTNSEEERSDVDWMAKGKFKIKGEAAKSARLEVLPLLLENQLDMGFCYNEVSARVVDMKLEKDAFNLAIERTFNLNIYCSPSNELADTTVTAVFHYSMVKTEAILSSGFKTVQYPKQDEDAFGFFKTERQELDTDNNASEKGLVSIMNHWNPNRSNITYYLSKNFSKPENQKIKALTQQVVDSLNLGLSQAGAKFQVNLEDGGDRSPGDIRNSMIVLVEDPIAASVIGYGPQVEDPLTGEIVSAKTVMFLGTIKTFIRHTYDDILREKKAARLLANQKPPVAPPADSTDPNGGLVIDDAMKFAWDGSFHMSRTTSDLHKVKSIKTIVKQVKEQKPSQPVALTPKEMQKAAAATRELTDVTRRKTSEYRGGVDAHLRYLNEAKNCAFGLNAELVAGISPTLMKLIPDDAKPWDQLSEQEKQDVIDIILPEVWVPTLIHEMGHNMGLRHNFGGSEDKDNFYSSVELKNLGVEHKIPSSTVMEYIDDLSALPVLGKYDIAALKFAYASIVTLAPVLELDAAGKPKRDDSGNVIVLVPEREVPVTGTIKETIAAGKKSEPQTALKEYRYCSDEHTGINAGCRRFDMGVTYTEIIENEIKTYVNRYELANRRAGRANFSLFDDPGYLARTQGRFTSMRLMQEVYERIKNDNGLSDDSPIWNDPRFPYLTDIKTASAMTGQFLMSVLATPDLTCVVSHASAPGQIAEIVRLDLVNKDKISCFDLNADFEAQNQPWRVIGQYGKLFQSRKDPNSENSWADQVDVRGYWLDKLAAARVLFRRDLGISTLDKSTDNFTDRADIGPDLLMLTAMSVMNKVTTETEVTWDDGAVEVTQVPMDSTMLIEKPIHPVLAKQMGVPNDTVSFNSVLLKVADQYMVNKAHEFEGNAFMNVLRVKVRDESSNLAPNQVYLDIAGLRYVASPENQVAQMAIVNHGVSSKLEAVEKQLEGRKKLIEIMNAKIAGQLTTPANATAAEVEVWKLDAKTIESYLRGDIAGPRFFEEVLLSLPQ